jgi:hypothetical protein
MEEIKSEKYTKKTKIKNKEQRNKERTKKEMKTKIIDLVFWY